MPGAPGALPVDCETAIVVDPADAMARTHSIIMAGDQILGAQRTRPPRAGRIWTQSQVGQRSNDPLSRLGAFGVLLLQRLPFNDQGHAETTEIAAICVEVLRALGRRGACQTDTRVVALACVMT